jgi:hypothetical protein
MKYCFSTNGLYYKMVSASYTPAAGEVLSSTFLTPADRATLIPAFTAAWAALSTEDKFMILFLNLSSLDKTVPRGLEDYWAQIGYDTTKLPAQTQAVLAAKISLRAQLAAIGG